MNYRFVGNSLTNCATLLGNYLGKEKDNENYDYFIVDFNRKFVLYNTEVPCITFTFCIACVPRHMVKLIHLTICLCTVSSIT